MTEPRRELSAFDIGCVVIGGIIGVGIFFTPRSVAAAVDTPQQVMLAWGLGGLLAVLGALVFAELALRVPGHGGMFLYLERAFGRTTAFLYGWANWLVIQAGALGVVALVLVEHLRLAVGASAWSPHVRIALAAGLMLAFTAINVLGLRVGKRVQNALIVLKVAALALLVVVAWRASTAPPEPLPEPSGRSLPAMLAAAMLPVLFATGGWQQGSFVAGAARRRLSVPLGILGGVAVVVVTYMTVNLAYLDLLGFAKARSAGESVGAAAAEVALGEGGARVLAAMVVVSAAGILNTICMAPPYVLYAMAQQGCFPAAFGRLHRRFDTPVLAVLGQGLWGVLLLLSVHAVVTVWGQRSTIDTLDFVCNGVVFADWLFFGLCGTALLVLRRRDGARADALPLGSVAALLFAAGALAVTVGAVVMRPHESLTGLALVLSGLVVRRWLGTARMVGDPPRAR